MDRLIIFAFATLLGALWLLTRWSDEVIRGPGVLVRGSPLQENHRKKTPPVIMGNWRLEPVASYQIEARVLEVENYDSDEIDELVPLDFLLGWGPMSDSGLIEKLDLGISRRYATWRYWGEAPASMKTISEHASNHHLVPADSSIRELLEGVRAGHIVTMRGELVNIHSKVGHEFFRSSLTRTDSGPGACEVMLVRSVSVR